MSGPPVLAVGLAIAAMLLVAVSAVFGDAASAIVPAAYGGAGTYVAYRRPANPIGWLLILTGWGVALGNVIVDADPVTLIAGESTAGIAIAAWASASGYAFAFLGLVSLTVIFPDGHLPARRGSRWGGLLAIALMVVIAMLIALSPTVVPTFTDTMIEAEVPNPLALAPTAPIWSIVPAPGELYPAMLVGIGVAGIVLVARARRATGAARLQYRWFLAAILLVLAATVVWAIAVTVFAADPRGPLYVLSQLALTSIPVAIAVAVLRYRLFEIDRIVSRTIGWAVVTALLAAIFAGINLALQGALESVVRGNAIAVAVSTLTVAALFQPVRRRVQRAVDRRFDRARYDSDRTASAFADRLRDETDIETLTAEFDAITRAALAPSTLSVWLRRAGR